MNTSMNVAKHSQPALLTGTNMSGVWAWRWWGSSPEKTIALFLYFTYNVSSLVIIFERLLDIDTVLFLIITQ
jgi:hypothetical protein